MKLTESPIGVDQLRINPLILRWDTGNGEIWLNITVTDIGIELYCAGEGQAKLNITSYNDYCNAITIQLELSKE